jgi:hypothetical protein
MLFPSAVSPPTFTFALPFWGSFAEEQPPDPTGGENPMHAVMGELFGQGALVLHGEQEFTYHRPIEVGMVLDGLGEVVDIGVKLNIIEKVTLDNLKAYRLNPSYAWKGKIS